MVSDNGQNAALQKPSGSAPSLPATTTTEDDPVLHLHRMSTTAGVGTQDYVAVNVIAVVGVLFGLGSSLALLGNALLVIPAAGIILSSIAWRQIRASNGTQTGVLLCIMGLVCSIGFASGSIGWQIMQSVRSEPDRRAIYSACTQFGQDLQSEKFDDAYTLFDADFQQRVSLPAFKAQLHTLQHNPLNPPVIGGEWNGLAIFNGSPDAGETAESMIKLNFQGGGEGRFTITLRRQDDGSWKFDTIPEIFPPPSKAIGQ